MPRRDDEIRLWSSFGVDSEHHTPREAGRALGMQSGRVEYLCEPCIAPGAHKFQASWPPPGQYGYVQVVCERCGMTAKEARR